MFHAVVRYKTRKVWRCINARDLDAPWRMAAEDLHFTFVGDTPLAAELVGRDAFRSWFAAVFERFADLHFEVLDVAVHGGPWRTRVAVRLALRATAADGGPYTNTATQWITLRWGRMTQDWVLEDTVALQRACGAGTGAVLQVPATS